MIKVICDNCKEEFYQHTHWAKINKHNFCNKYCYYEWRKDIKNHPHWKGGKVLMQNYEFTKMPEHPYSSVTGYVKTARLIMERKLKRYLDPEEVIHHIDKIRTNNSIENLMLFANKSEHQKHHWDIRKLGKQLQLILYRL